MHAFLLGAVVYALADHPYCAMSCPTGLSCCRTGDDGGHCYNSTAGEVCASCPSTWHQPCSADKPRCCSHTRSSTYPVPCYGEGEKCCTDSGKVASDAEFCVGACGVTSDPNLKCCTAQEALYDNRTHCCAGSGSGAVVCDLSLERCTECGCIALNDTRTECCGGRKYTNDTQQCCNNKSVCSKSNTCSDCGCLSRPDVEKCCHNKVFVPLAGESCCSADGQTLVCKANVTCHTYPLASGTAPICCDDGLDVCEGYNMGTCMNSSTSFCCNGEICALGQKCCRQDYYGRCC